MYVVMQNSCIPLVLVFGKLSHILVKYKCQYSNIQKHLFIKNSDATDYKIVTFLFCLIKYNHVIVTKKMGYKRSKLDWFYLLNQHLILNQKQNLYIINNDTLHQYLFYKNINIVL